MRLFIAARPEPALCEQLVALQEAWRQEGVSGRYVPPENLHMTLLFLGECTPAQKDRVTAILDRLPCPKTELASVGPGSFRSLWYLGFRRDSSLEAWIRRLKQALKEAGIPFDDKRFFPHVTLIRKASRGPAGPAPELVFRISGATLFQSGQQKGTLVYTPLFSQT